MDNQRLILWMALAFILVLIWQAWEAEHRPPPPAAGAKTAPAPKDDVPAPPREVRQPAQAAPEPVEVVSQAERIKVTTDLLEAEVDTQGGDLRVLRLRRYPVAVDQPDQPLLLLRDEGGELHIAQSGLIAHAGKLPNHNTRFAAEKLNYRLEGGAQKLVVPLSWTGADGVRYSKRYVFRANTYLIDVEFEVYNRAQQPWRGFLYTRFVRHHIDQRGWLALPTYTGPAIYTTEDKYQKISFEELAEKPLRREVSGGWVAVLQHYFVSAWLPPRDQRNQLYSDVLAPGRYAVGYKNLEPTEIAPGATGRLTTQLYVGPKEQQRLAQLPEGMELTVDYGWLTIIAAPLFWLLDRIHDLIGNWGWAIIVLTILIKLAFYPLSAASYKSMAQMKKLQPRMQALKERYGDDKQKFQQAMMEMYKTEKINPLGGCLPILVQIPVFIALYWVLLESVEMRQAPFVLWIKDLSVPDPYFILPLVMGATMWWQMKLNPAPVDPIQKKMFTFMPIIFTVFFLFFPAGLVLYWVVNNVLSIAQQWRINQVIGASAKTG